MEEYEALHQIAKDVELEIDELGGSRRERRRQEQDGCEDDENGAEQPRSVDAVDDRDDNEPDENEKHGASQIDLRQRVGPEMDDEKSRRPDVEEAMGRGDEEVKRPECYDEPPIRLEDV